MAPVLAAAVTMLPFRADADEASRTSRGVHGGIGGGWFGSVGGPNHGPLVEAELYPGGALGRVGFRAELRGFEGTEEGWLTGGVTYEAAASRPHLQLALHGDAGLTSAGRPVAGAGVQTQLWVAGPLALGLDTGAHLLFEGLDSELVVSAALTLRLAH